MCLLAKQHTALNWKDVISVFPVCHVAQYLLSVYFQQQRIIDLQLKRRKFFLRDTVYVDLHTSCYDAAV